MSRFKVFGLGVTLTALSLAFVVPSASAQEVSWQYQRSVKSKPGAVMSSASATVGDQGLSLTNADLYTLGVYCNSGTFSVAFLANQAHFTERDVSVDWNIGGQPAHHERWKSPVGSGRFLYPPDAKAFVVNLLSGKSIGIHAIDSNNKVVSATFPLMGAAELISMTMSDCGVKAGVHFNPKDRLTDALFLLAKGGELRYPKRAFKKDQKGYVDLLYTVSKIGRVTHVRILREAPGGWGFGKAAVKTVKAWRYQPYIEDGKPTERPGIRVRIRFRGRNN